MSRIYPSFADDTLLFCKDDEDMLAVLFQLIVLFETCSSLKVNWAKSAGCGINIDDKKQCDMLKGLTVNLKVYHFCTLVGLPLGGYPYSTTFCSWFLIRYFKKL